MTGHKNKPKASPVIGGLEGYLKRHRHGFILLVSLLLLFALFLKERIRDKAKEESDVVANARNMFYLRMDVLRAADQIMENIEPGKDDPGAAVLPPDQLELKLKEQLKQDFRGSIATIHMTDTLSRLAGVLDLSEKDSAKLEDIQKRNIERGQLFEQTSKSLETHSATQADLRAAKKIASDASALDWEILDFGTSLGDKADAEVEKQESRYRWSSNASYFLAVFLWYLYFLGKRFDIDLPEAVEA